MVRLVLASRRQFLRAAVATAILSVGAPALAAGPGPRLMMLVHHDDPAREYAYGEGSPIGTFSAALMDEAKSRGWAVIRMKDDWKQVFDPAP
jgi:hypothetical protein